MTTVSKECAIEDVRGRIRSLISLISLRCTIVVLAAMTAGPATAAGQLATGASQPSATASTAVPDVPPAVLDVTLLGTGTPLPVIDRFGPATLVEAGNEKLLFDCGRGCSIRLHQKGVSLRTVKLFLTHHHSDHTVGIPDLWLTGSLPVVHRGGRTSRPLHVAGPPGTRVMMERLKEAYAADTVLRVAQDRLPEPAFEARDIGPGVVYESEGLKVTAFEVDHGEHLKPAYGYRVDYRGRSVVISGDTRFSKNVIEQSTGADLLIHEVAAVKAEVLARAPVARLVLDVHTTPQDAGRVFTAARPRLAVFTHFVVAGQVGRNVPLPSDIEAAARETYSGPLALGEDLMTIRVGETIDVARHKPPPP